MIPLFRNQIIGAKPPWVPCVHPENHAQMAVVQLQNPRVWYQGNQQYSITAMTNGGGSIGERYAYDAYGTRTITDTSGTAQTTSSENSR